jgi:uncharacterized protein (DUF433 family)
MLFRVALTGRAFGDVQGDGGSRPFQLRAQIETLAFWQTGAQVMDEQLVERITLNPEVMAGKPVIRGTRIPVELIVRMLAQGIPESEILKEYPRLQPEDLRAALAYAAQTLAHEDVFPLST